MLHADHVGEAIIEAGSDAIESEHGQMPRALAHQHRTHRRCYPRRDRDGVNRLDEAGGINQINRRAARHPRHVDRDRPPAQGIPGQCRQPRDEEQGKRGPELALHRVPRMRAQEARRRPIRPSSDTIAIMAAFRPSPARCSSCGKRAAKPLIQNKPAHRVG